MLSITKDWWDTKNNYFIKLKNQSDVSKITYDSKTYLMHCPNRVERPSTNYLHPYKVLF